jgi:hypothetical protein
MMRRAFPWAAGLAAVTIAGGCRTIARENILSAINTGIGVQVAENPQTQLYEVKIGYIRSQAYSVPTGKVVESEDAAGNPVPGTLHNDAERTPEVVAGIRMRSGVEQLFVGVDVSENFAVGRVAVMSPAAVAMYIADAASEDRANAAADAVRFVGDPQVTDTIRGLESKADEIVRAVDASGTVSPAIDDLLAGTPLAGRGADLHGKPVADLRRRLDGSWFPYIDQLHQKVQAKKPGGK